MGTLDRLEKARIATTGTLRSAFPMPSARGSARADRAAIPARRSQFFVGMAMLMIVLVFAGFSRTFFLRDYFRTTDLLGTPHLPAHLVVHGLVLSAWFVFAFTQSVLVDRGRTSLHRRLGAAGAALAVLVVVTSVWTIVREIPRLEAVGVSAAAYAPVVFRNLGELVAFSGCFARGIGRRRQPGAHKRLMMLASASITAPAVTRIAEALGLPPFALGAPALLALCLPLSLGAYDLWSERRVHPATRFGVALIALCACAGPLAGRSAAGRSLLALLG